MSLLLLSFHSNLFTIKSEKFSNEVNINNFNKNILFDTFLPDSSIFILLNSLISYSSEINISKPHYRVFFISLLSPPLIYLKKAASREIGASLALCAKLCFSEFSVLCYVLFAISSSTLWHFSLLGVLKDVSNNEKEQFLRNLFKNCHSSDVLFNIASISTPSCIMNNLCITWNETIFTFIHLFLTRQSVPLVFSVDFLNEIKLILLEITSIFHNSILLARIIQFIISTNSVSIISFKDEWKNIIKQIKVEIMQESLESLLN